MVRTDPQFDTVEDDVTIWRYLEVGHFIALLKAKALYFAHRYEFEDLWEGEHPLSLKNYIAANIPPEVRDPIVKLLVHTADHAVINCWHENNDESLAMWKLYVTGKEGVAIQSTVGKLKQALNGPDHTILIGRVRYVSYEDPNASLTGVEKTRIALSHFAPLFHKGTAYGHEREIRAVILPEGANANFDWSETPLEIPTERGFSVPVDLKVLIDKIVVSPGFPLWELDALQDLIGFNGLSLRVQESALIRSPR